MDDDKPHGRVWRQFSGDYPWIGHAWGYWADDWCVAFRTWAEAYAATRTEVFRRRLPWTASRRR